MKTEKDPYKIKSNKKVKKVWANTNITKLQKKYEELNKQYDDFKENFTEEQKREFIEIKMFIKRMLKHIGDIMTHVLYLNAFGYSYIICELMSYDKAM